MFTAEPEAFYADRTGKVHGYTFEEWKSEMKKLGKGNKKTNKKTMP